jgi:hypothetical protein
MEWMLAPSHSAQGVSGRRVVWLCAAAVALLSMFGAAQSAAPACNHGTVTTPPSEGEHAPWGSWLVWET